MTEPAAGSGSGAPREAHPGRDAPPGERQPGAAPDSGERPPSGGRELWDQWKGFCIALLVGCLLVFSFEMASLIGALDEFEGGMEKGALWAMLLMIFATLGVVAVIGGGLYRAIRRDRRRQSGGAEDEPRG